MAFGIGYLLGTVLLLAVVLYVTRIRSPPVPRDTDAKTLAEPEPCELCGAEQFCQEVQGMMVCRECKEELL